MTLSLDENRGSYLIKSYQPGQIQVNETIYQQSLILSKNLCQIPWAPQVIDELKAEDLAPILTAKPSILLIGTGEKLRFPSIDIYGELINQGIGVEIMDTHAACRTFNALVSEERDVMAALIIR